MKLSDWARKNGISYKTAWRWVKEGRMPVPFEQTPSGTILVHEPEPSTTNAVALYARVSSADQKADLDRQIARLMEFAMAQKLVVVKAVTEIGSGLNGHRPKLMKMLSDPNAHTIVVEHRDRLMRFGFEYVEAALAAQGRRILVVEPGEVKDDLVQDMVEVLTSFCARLYGRRSARHRAKRALEVLEREDSSGVSV
ncbi:IS607 family transposase [Alicyclobacillus acidocaldarius]|uniref:Resolvase domain protein n=1 Tax=Alicyclobacillus acidocaldarius subsp. acidocaldarius (strain ATCC 27009 / DSM 446 / BCRC 14685 / JCM 5260 / KCTC 1825 / NBRC 15652 / NCIMB 11725 / NRRL B-14509 / 104-IA) TaxID=521098 RepID=C8WSN3_ALIAD|nr:IS607 family transposase [Alicyclobacillus acidocaldarius]ACV59518.1 Resolvase domain protein [Alicyclobacillus acidocaldarius subsp. acidocaldarius DSM 446]